MTSEFIHLNDEMEHIEEALATHAKVYTFSDDGKVNSIAFLNLNLTPTTEDVQKAIRPTGEIVRWIFAHGKRIPIYQDPEVAKILKEVPIRIEKGFTPKERRKIFQMLKFIKKNNDPLVLKGINKIVFKPTPNSADLLGFDVKDHARVKKTLSGLYKPDNGSIHIFSPALSESHKTIVKNYSTSKLKMSWSNYVIQHEIAHSIFHRLQMDSLIKSPIDNPTRIEYRKVMSYINNVEKYPGPTAYSSKYWTRMAREEGKLEGLRTIINMRRKVHGNKIVHDPDYRILMSKKSQLEVDVPKMRVLAHDEQFAELYAAYSFPDARLNTLRGDEGKLMDEFSSIIDALKAGKFKNELVMSPQ